MRPDSSLIRSSGFLTFALLLVASLAFVLPASAQDVGGDLGGAAGIFRPKNPETTSRRRSAPSSTPGIKPPTV